MVLEHEAFPEMGRANGVMSGKQEDIESWGTETRKLLRYDR